MHVTELTTQLTNLYKSLKEGTIDVKIAAEMNNTAGKIINVQRVQLEYAALRKETPNITFLDGCSIPPAPKKVRK